MKTKLLFSLLCLCVFYPQKTNSQTFTPSNSINFSPLNDGRNTADGITWYLPSPQAYGIFRTPGAWSSPNYQQLKLAWTTGIILDGGNNTYYTYNGTTLQPNGGNVRIGSTSSTSNLFVYGGITSSTLMIDNHQSADWTHAFYLKVDRDLTKAFTICDKNSIEVFNVYGNGIVNTKKIYAEAFEVRPDAANIYWYDHVFAANYKLKPLSEVEKYVKENSHLPEIPSEREVKEKGFNMAEMDGLLLKKIEELTLYVIQQQKEIEQLKQNQTTTK